MYFRKGGLVFKKVGFQFKIPFCFKIKHAFSVIKESSPKSCNIMQNMYICTCAHAHTHTQACRESGREPTKKISSFLFKSKLSLNNFSFWFLSSDIKQKKKIEFNYSLLMLTHNILYFLPCRKTHNEHPGSEV